MIMNRTTKTDWEKLSKINDREIDYSDIPETDSGFWEDATLLFPQKKIELSIKIDVDLAKWFISKGKSSNMALNSLIRAYYLMHT